MQLAIRKTGLKLSLKEILHLALGKIQPEHVQIISSHWNNWSLPIRNVMRFLYIKLIWHLKILIMHAIIIVNYTIFIHERSMFNSKDIFYKNQHNTYLCTCAINYFYKKQKKISASKYYFEDGFNYCIYNLYIQYDLFYIKKYNKYSIFYWPRPFFILLLFISNKNILWYTLFVKNRSLLAAHLELVQTSDFVRSISLWSYVRFGCC